MQQISLDWRLNPKPLGLASSARAKHVPPQSGPMQFSWHTYFFSSSACLLPLAWLPQGRRSHAVKLAMREAQRGVVVRHTHETIVRLVVCSTAHVRCADLGLLGF